MIATIVATAIVVIVAIIWRNGYHNRKTCLKTLVTSSTEQSAAEEVKTTRELFALAGESHNALDRLLEKYELWRVLRAGAWIARFLHNVRAGRQKRVVGPLTTEEIKKQTTKRAQ